MTASVPFRVTADVLEQLETGGATVRSVAASEDALYDGEEFGTDVRAEVPLLGGLELPERLSVSLSEAEVVDGRLRVTVSVRTAGADPVYKDPEALREVYEAHDTFPEMTEALGADVEPQTVRKHMVRAGIHEPERPNRPFGDSASHPDGAEDDAPGAEGSGTKTAEPEGEKSEPAEPESEEPEGNEPDGSGATGATDDSHDGRDSHDGHDREGRTGQGGSDGADDPEGGDERAPGPAAEIATDGLGLPDGVTLADLCGALEEARTLHEVQSRTGVERERLQRCLGNLGLLDLVVGRVADRERPASPEEIRSRIARATA
jgi:hypothetical protein